MFFPLTTSLCLELPAKVNRLSTLQLQGRCDGEKKASNLLPKCIGGAASEGGKNDAKLDFIICFKDSSVLGIGMGQYMNGKSGIFDYN